MRKIPMRKTLLTALTAAALLSGGMLGNRAEAMMLAAPSELGVAAADTGLVQKTVLVCGPYRCALIWPRYHAPYAYGYYGRPYGYGYGYGRGYGYYGRPYGYGYGYGRGYGYYGRPYGYGLRARLLRARLLRARLHGRGYYGRRW